MPNISKVKKTNLPVVAKTTKKKTKKPKTSPVAYYNCLLTKAQSGWYDPTTGQKKKITACCKECKASAPTLNEQRSKELAKLITAYQQVGESLKKLLKPLN
jgi:carboxypeptidase C (cathepsin A)